MEEPLPTAHHRRTQAPPSAELALRIVPTLRGAQVPAQVLASAGCVVHCGACTQPALRGGNVTEVGMRGASCGGTGRCLASVVVGEVTGTGPAACAGERMGALRGTCPRASAAGPRASGTARRTSADGAGELLQLLRHAGGGTRAEEPMPHCRAGADGDAPAAPAGREDGDVRTWEGDERPRSSVRGVGRTGEVGGPRKRPLGTKELGTTALAQGCASETAGAVAAEGVGMVGTAAGATMMFRLTTGVAVAATADSTTAACVMGIVAITAEETGDAGAAVGDHCVAADSTTAAWASGMAATMADETGDAGAAVGDHCAAAVCRMHSSSPLGVSCMQPLLSKLKFLGCMPYILE